MCRRSKVNPVLCAPLSFIKPITNAALFFSLRVAAWNINFTNRLGKVIAIHWFWVHTVSTALGINVGKGCLPRKAVTLTVRRGVIFRGVLTYRGFFN